MNTSTSVSRLEPTIDSARSAVASTRIERVERVARNAAGVLSRYGLVVVIAWIGAMKFFAFEANGIQPLVAHSPLLRWAYSFLSVQQFSSALGVVELSIAALLAIGFVAPRLSAVGAAAAIGMFLTTLSFLGSTPGIWEASKGGFPFMGLISSFLVKDVLLLAAAVWCLADSLEAVIRRNHN